jgi:Domain of unknown function (DUF3437)
VRAADSRLRDERVEVRADAAQLLSGLLKVAPADAFYAFRADAVAAAARLFPQRRKRRRGSNGGSGAAAATPEAPPPLVERHACALELQALLLSCPYSVAGWMHEVLLCVAAAARAPDPVKKAATGAIGEFRRNQAATSPLPLRDRLPEAVWEAIQGVASTSSYFV